MKCILPEINCPADIRGLSPAELEILAEEIRSLMLEVVSKNGGHLAPGLGVVELTLALHSEFNTPQDKLVWDVGHQTYAHKIITGRRDLFPTLRQFRGMSGFPKRSESEYDCFDTGHSSTSISAALGMAKARDLKREKHRVVAIIGDGALTGGLAYEALNQAGDLKTDLIVILNDNEMSIVANVGAMAGYLSRMRTDPRYGRGKEEIEQILKRIPKVGPQVAKTVERVKDSLKYLMVPGMLFEEMGFTYLGPVDGHNLAAMKHVLQNAKKLKGPVLVHMMTQKGRGYHPAEQNQDLFHGIGPFEIETGETVKKSAPPTYTEVFGETLVKLARSNDKIVAITAAMPMGTGLDKFAAAHPDRFFDVGIAEQHAVTFAAGLAAEGFHPVVAVYSTFLQRAFDQVLHDVAMQKLPVTLAIDRAGLVGEDGETHQGVFDISFLRPIPNLVLMAPKDEGELRQMVAAALNIGGPSAIRYPRGSGSGADLSGEVKPLPIGRGEMVRDGSQLCIFAIGTMVATALQAADLLAREGIEAAVVNARFIKPLDQQLLREWADRTGRIVTLEEHVLAGGFGSACLEFLQEACPGTAALSIGLPDSFVEQGKADVLRKHFGLTPLSVAEKVIGRWPELQPDDAALQGDGGC